MSNRGVRTLDEQLACTASFIQQNLNSHIPLARLHHLVIRQRGDAQLFQRIVRVGNQLAQKDVFVRVQRVDDEGSQARDVGLCISTQLHTRPCVHCELSRSAPRESYIAR